MNIAVHGHANSNALLYYELLMVMYIHKKFCSYHFGKTNFGEMPNIGAYYIYCKMALILDNYISFYFGNFTVICHIHQTFPTSNFPDIQYIHT